jgi:Putative zinc-finger
MEHAPLRPVPGRPVGPVPDAAAVTLVAGAVPGLNERDRTALALVSLAGTARPAVAQRLGIGEEELADSLSHARKQLRRTLAALPGSGWCERAERMISDRIDGVLAERDEARLDVHLRNCPRCVEHERRLVQATDALVAGVAPSPSAPAPVLEQRAPEAPDGEAAQARGRGALAASAASQPAAPTPEEAAARRSARELAGARAVLIAIVILLVLAALALALAGALGVQL